MASSTSHPLTEQECVFIEDQALKARLREAAVRRHYATSQEINTTTE